MLALSEQFWAGVAVAVIAGTFTVIAEVVRRRGRRVEELVRDTHAETKTNGGKSMRDDIKRIAETAENIQRRIGTMDNRQLIIEQRLATFDERIAYVTEHIGDMRPAVHELKLRLHNLTELVTDPGPVDSADPF